MHPSYTVGAGPLGLSTATAWAAPAVCSPARIVCPPLCCAVLQNPCLPTPCQPCMLQRRHAPSPSHSQGREVAHWSPMGCQLDNPVIKNFDIVFVPDLESNHLFWYLVREQLTGEKNLPFWTNQNISSWQKKALLSDLNALYCTLNLKCFIPKNWEMDCFDIPDSSIPRLSTIFFEKEIPAKSARFCKVLFSAKMHVLTMWFYWHLGVTGSIDDSNLLLLYPSLSYSWCCA